MDHDQNDGAAECTETAVPDFSMDDATSGGFNAWFQSLPQVYLSWISHILF